jgi:hypothetical protein
VDMNVVCSEKLNFFELFSGLYQLGESILQSVIEL